MSAHVDLPGAQGFCAPFASHTIPVHLNLTKSEDGQCLKHIERKISVLSFQEIKIHGARAMDDLTQGFSQSIILWLACIFSVHLSSVMV